MGKRYFLGLKIFLIGILLTSFCQEITPLKYMQQFTIEGVSEEFSTIVSFKDALSSDTLYLKKSKDGLPLYYYKNIIGEVCNDDECRLLDIVIYWNITGRYLGFELPKDEFLSKHDHEPFTKKEYLRLHALLADETLPLDAVSFEKLVEQPKNENGIVDAVSGATSKSVVDMVVKGAAYTTYKLWNRVNGPTMDVVSELTEKQLTPELIHLILLSPNNNDKLWALNRIDSATKLTSDLETSLLEVISSDDFYLAYSAIHGIDATHLKSMELQQHLFSIYPKANHSIQKELVNKLMQAPILSSKVVVASRDLLNQLNGQQLDGLLKLYVKNNVSDLETCKSVAKILENENKYISKKAYDFLLDIQTEDEFIMERLKTYKKH